MANRKIRRKSKESYSDEYTQSTKSIIITLVVVLVIFALFYLMTVVINNKNRKLKTKEPTDTVIQYNEILGDDTFTMGPDEYYVLFYDFDGVDAGYYDYIFNKHSATKGNYIYKVDLGSGFNTKFISKETNKKAKNAGTLKVKEATLIKIEKGKNVEYVEGTKQDIAKALMD